MDFAALRAQLANPDTQDRLSGIGQALGGLARGQVADLSGVRQSIADRQAHADILGNNDLLAQFTPEQRAMLASLPPQAAQQIIAETVFAAPDPAIAAREQLRSSGVLNQFTPEQQQVLLSLPPDQAQKIIGEVTFAEPEKGHRVLSANEVRAMGLPPGSYQQSPDGKITSIGGGGQNININTGADSALPDGFVSIDEKTGLAVMLDPLSPTGVRQVPIPGGAADVDRRAADAEAALAAQNEEDAEAARENETANSTTVISNAVDSIFEADAQRVLTGAAGEAVSGIGGTSNRDILNHLDTLKGAGAFAALSQMREQSATGASGLGALSEAEMRLLVAQAGALDPASANFTRDLRNYERALLTTIHGQEAGARIWAENQERRNGSGAQPQDTSAPPLPSLTEREQQIRALSEEELRAIIERGQ